MGYDKFGIDWSVYGNKTPQRENSGNPMQDSIGKGWSQSNVAPVGESDVQESPAP
ncbi:MAG TPA: hypothetical protein VHO70_07980 [Chitinispirillaceae bacterium]|nr:hypothetical protein [Chitinispirillaceae bacterium]